MKTYKELLEEITDTELLEQSSEDLEDGFEFDINRKEFDNLNRDVKNKIEQLSDGAIANSRILGKPVVMVSPLEKKEALEILNLFIKNKITKFSDGISIKDQIKKIKKL